METSFYSVKELQQIGFASLGQYVLISRKASIYNAANMHLGSHVRVDDFCILSGKIQLGNYIHIAAYTALYGGNAGVFVDNYANISSKNIIYAISDDYSGQTMTNPLVPKTYRNVDESPVYIQKHVIIGSGCVVLPGTVLGEGCALGAMSLVKDDCEPFFIYAGTPAKKIKRRSRQVLSLAEKLEEEVLNGKN